MRIAIVEDDEKDMEHLRSVVDAYAGSRNMPVQIDTFSSGEDFLRAFEPKKYALVFFDNYIGNGLGIDFARRTRAQDPEVEFAFVSMSPEFAVSGFEVRALHYIIKPATPDAIDRRVRLYKMNALLHRVKAASAVSEYFRGKSLVQLL